MKQLITWLIIFIVIYLLYLLFVILRKKKMSKFSDNVYVNYLVNVYKLDKKKLNIKSLAHIIALANAFIVATAFIIVSYIKNFILMLLVAIVVLLPLLLIIYHIIGKQLKRREQNV